MGVEAPRKSPAQFGGVGCAGYMRGRCDHFRAGVFLTRPPHGHASCSTNGGQRGQELAWGVPGAIVSLKHPKLPAQEAWAQ